MDQHCLAFGDFRLDRRRGTLARGDEQIALRRKSFAVLQYLAENPGRLVPREELFQAIWGHVVVTDGTLTQCLIDIRRALDDGSQTIVRTVRGRGVRFELPVTEWVEPAAPETSEAALPSFPEAAAAAEPTVPALPAPSTAATGWRWARLGFAAAASAGLLLLAGAAHMHADSPAGVEPDTGVGEYLVQARFLYNRRAEGDLDRAVSLYQRALDLQPDSADAWVGLSAVHSLKALEGQDPRENLDAAGRAAQRALVLDPASVEAHLRLARVAATQGDAASARQLFARAVQLDPAHPLVLSARAGDAMAKGQLEEAIVLFRRAMDSDPISLVNHVNLGGLLLGAGHVAEAEDASRHALALHPPGVGEVHAAEQTLVDALILQHRLDEAADVIARWPAGSERDRAEALIHASLGDAETAEIFVARLQADESWTAALWLAEIYARAGASDEAQRWVALVRQRATGAGTSFTAREAEMNLAVSPFVREAASGTNETRLAAG